MPELLCYPTNIHKEQAYHGLGVRRILKYSVYGPPYTYPEHAIEHIPCALWQLEGENQQHIRRFKVLGIGYKKRGI